MADQPITVHWKQDAGGLVFVYIYLQACQTPGKFFGIGFETSYRERVSKDSNPRTIAMWQKGIEEHIREEARILLTTEPGAVLSNYLLRIGEFHEYIIKSSDVLVLSGEKWTAGVEELKREYRRREDSPFFIHRDKWPEPKAAT